MRVKGKSGNGNVSYNDLLDKPFYEGGGREIVNIPVGDIWLTKGGNFGYTNDDGSGGGVVERFNLIDKELSADKKYEVIFNEKSYICDYERISEDSLKIFNKRLQILDYYDSWGYGNQTIFDLPEKPTTPIIINEINMKQIDKKFIPTLTLENLDVSLVGKKMTKVAKYLMITEKLSEQVRKNMVM